MSQNGTFLPSHFFCLCSPSASVHSNPAHYHGRRDNMWDVCEEEDVQETSWRFQNVRHCLCSSPPFRPLRHLRLHCRCGEYHHCRASKWACATNTLCRSAGESPLDIVYKVARYQSYTPTACSTAYCAPLDVNRARPPAHKVDALRLFSIGMCCGSPLRMLACLVASVFQRSWVRGHYRAGALSRLSPVRQVHRLCHLWYADVGALKHTVSLSGSGGRSCARWLWQPRPDRRWCRDVLS